MSRRHEWQELGQARRDPAVSFLLLLPLALLHLSGRNRVDAGAYAIVENALAPIGIAAVWILATLCLLGFTWAIGRVRVLEIPWRGGAALLVVEGIVWGFLLGPVLRVLTQFVSAQVQPLAIDWGLVHGQLALAAGAGLYEELLFRAGLMSGSFVLLAGFLSAFHPRDAARTFSFGLALLISSMGFALAHAIGDPSALDAGPFLFRTLAGVVLGLLFTWRGLAVVAYAHATYDAQYLLG